MVRKMTRKDCVLSREKAKVKGKKEKTGQMTFPVSIIFSSFFTFAF
jgi:hypothetical protein